MRLLVVEDETRIVELLRSAFERASFVVDAVGAITEGDQALSLVAYDAVILDLGLPDGDGLRLLVKIRSGGNRVPVLILTARDAVEDRLWGMMSWNAVRRRSRGSSRGPRTARHVSSSLLGWIRSTARRHVHGFWWYAKPMARPLRRPMLNLRRRSGGGRSRDHNDTPFDSMISARPVRTTTV